MTIEKFLAAARHLKGPRDQVEKLWLCGIPFTVWTAGGFWFAEADGVKGFGVGEDRESVVVMAKAAIEDGDYEELDGPDAGPDEPKKGPRTPAEVEGTKALACTA